MEFYETQLRRQYRLLKHNGHWTQAHCHDTNTKKIVSRELLNGEQAVITWAKENNGKGNCFIGRNPRSNVGDVQHCTTLSLDIDPIRPKDTAATENQWCGSVQAARRIVRTLSCGITLSSGNGALVLLSLHESVSPECAEGWGKALEERARSLVEGLNVQVDATWDAPRLVKAMGCVSTKGDKSLWRTARFVDSGHSSCSAEFLNGFSRSTNAKFQIPAIEKGTLDRSKTDIAMANRLKLQGFSAEDTFTALCQYATRPGREDDYQRIIKKVYYNEGDVAGMVSGTDNRPIELWTPDNGLEEYKNRKHEGSPELPTGFKAIDTATFGLQRGHIYTVGARTNCGKTTFAIGAALNLCGLGKSVLYVSTETQYKEVWDRYIAQATGHTAFSIQHGLLTDESSRDLAGFLKDFKDRHKFTVYDGSRPNITIITKAIEQTAPDVLIFDYFQHVESRETRELEEFVMRIKELAKLKNIAVLMCAQLHDRYNPQTGKQYPPTLQDMKSCKVLNDESRVVVLLDWDRDAVTGDGPAAVKAIMAKNKGEKSDVVLKLDRAIPRFTDEV